MSGNIGSGLYYYGTHDEVRLGDRVRIKRWLRSDLYGTVCYIPGLSPTHAAIGNDQWAIRLDDETVVAMGYFPEDQLCGQPGKKYILVGRGTGGELDPNERLD